MKDQPCNDSKPGLPLNAAPPISVSRFLEISGNSPVTFWRWENRGWIRTVRIAGRKYITAAELHNFTRRLEAGEFAGKTQNPSQVARGAKGGQP